MSCFDDLIAKLKCPNTGQEKEEYLQLFIRKSRIDAKTYRIGSKVELDKKNTLWFSTDYVCSQCSKKTKGKHSEYIKTEDQSRHNCYINIKENKILEIITEQEYKQRKLPDCPDQDEYEFN
jgi:hypothetical protein